MNCVSNILEELIVSLDIAFDILVGVYPTVSNESTH
jgi:hypothetical protein